MKSLPLTAGYLSQGKNNWSIFTQMNAFIQTRMLMVPPNLKGTKIIDFVGLET